MRNAIKAWQGQIQLHMCDRSDETLVSFWMIAILQIFGGILWKSFW